LALAALIAAGCGGSDKGAGADEPGAGGDDKPTIAPSDGGDDSEPDDIEVQGTKGTFQPGQIETSIQPHARELSACYEDFSRKTKYVGGKIELRYAVGKDGSLLHVQVAQSDLGSWTVEKCILGVARSVKFPAPKGGDAEFSVPLAFTSPRSPDWWDEGRAATEVGDVVGQLSECGAASDVTVTLYVGPRGKVTSVGFASAAKTPLTDDWADCAETKIKSWVMTDPRGKIAKMSFRHGG
jgi:hypothetical protein